MSGLPTPKPLHCDHEWVIESEQTAPALSHAHPHGPAPPQWAQVDVVCKKCGVSRERDHD